MMRYVCKWLAIDICAVLAFLTLLLVVPGLFGIHPLIVQSQSMEPVYPAGSMLYIKEADADSGDLTEEVATFYLPDQETSIVGVPIFCIPYLGYVAEGLSGTFGKFCIFLMVVLVFFLSWLDGAMHHAQSKVQKMDIIPKK